MDEKAENKSQVRAWLFQALADLEHCENVEAKITESAGRHVVIDIQYQY